MSLRGGDTRNNSNSMRRWDAAAKRGCEG